MYISSHRLTEQSAICLYENKMQCPCSGDKMLISSGVDGEIKKDRISFVEVFFDLILNFITHCYK